MSLHISLLPIVCIVHNVKIDCVAPQDVNIRVTWGYMPVHTSQMQSCVQRSLPKSARCPDIISFPRSAVVWERDFEVGALVTKSRNSTQYMRNAVLGCLHEKLSEPPFRVSFLRKIRGGTWESWRAVGTLSSLLVVALLTMWLKPLPLYARYNNNAC